MVNKLLKICVHFQPNRGKMGRKYLIFFAIFTLVRSVRFVFINFPEKQLLQNLGNKIHIKFLF